jgi:hypothetical protein
VVSKILPESVCELHVARVFGAQPSQESWDLVEQVSRAPSI